MSRIPCERPRKGQKANRADPWPTAPSHPDSNSTNSIWKPNSRRSWRRDNRPSWAGWIAADRSTHISHPQWWTETRSFVGWGKATIVSEMMKTSSFSLKFDWKRRGRIKERIRTSVNSLDYGYRLQTIGYSIKRGRCVERNKDGILLYWCVTAARSFIFSHKISNVRTPAYNALKYI